MTFHSFCTLPYGRPTLFRLIIRGNKNCTVQNFHTMRHTVGCRLCLYRTPFDDDLNEEKKPALSMRPAFSERRKSSFPARKSEHNFMAFK